MICCVGDLMLDVLVVPEFSLPEQSAGVHVRGGGSAANTAAWLATLGTSTCFVGCVGDDSVGSMLKTELMASGVHAHVRSIPHEESGTVVVEVRTDGERIMRSSRGANQFLRGGDLARVHGEMVHAVHLTGYALLGHDGWTVLEGAAELARESHGLLSFDPSSVSVIERIGATTLLSALQDAGVRLLLPNASEALALTDISELLHAAESLLDFVPAIAIKDGRKGAVSCQSPDGVITCPVDAIDPVDSTGAGDAFDAAILHNLTRGKSLPEATQRANRIAAKAIVQYGGRPTPIAATSAGEGRHQEPRRRRH